MDRDKEILQVPPDGNITATTNEPGIVDKFQLLISNPASLFESIKRESSWLPPLIVFIVITIIAGFIAQSHIMPSVRQVTMDYLSGIPNLPEGTLQKTMDSFDEASEMTAASIIKGILGGAISKTIFYFVVVTIIFLSGSILFGGTARYVKVMSVYAWVLPIWALGTIIVTPLMIIKESFFISLSPAVLIPPDPSNSLYCFLKSLSLFNIWAIILTGLGFSIIYGISRIKGVIMLLVIWGVWIAISSFVPYLNFQALLMGLT